MIQSDYALSYNVKDKVLDILWSICDFETWSRAEEFMGWFNGIIEAKGRVVMAEICKKMKKNSIEAFERIGFNDMMSENDIFEVRRMDGSEFYQILFPVLKDFTQKGAK